jgi:hypothetical protein
MTTITVPSTDGTPEQISQTLRAGLGRRYHLLPAAQGTLHPDAIVIGTGSSPLWHTQVRIDPRKVRRVLHEAPAAQPGQRS